MNKTAFLKLFSVIFVLATVFLPNVNTVKVFAAEEVTAVAPDDLTDKSFTVTNSYEVTEGYGHYYFTLKPNGINLSEEYEISAFWIFDGDSFASNAIFQMTVETDPTKTHSLSVIVNVKNQVGDIVKSVELPKSYYKDGKVLENPTAAQTPQKNHSLKLIYLPIIALILLIVYLTYFKKQSYTGGLGTTIDRLGGIINMDVLIDNVINNEKLTDKQKLHKIRLLYKTVKLNLTSTLNMLKTYALDTGVTIDTKPAVESISAALNFMDKDYKKLSLNELIDILNTLLKEHLTTAISVCKMIEETNNKYLKKMNDAQI